MVWKTKDWRFIEISQLSDDHLSNIVTMLRRDGYVTEGEWFSVLAGMCRWSESSTYEAGRNFDKMKTHTVAEAIFEEYEIRQFMKSQERVLEVTMTDEEIIKDDIAALREECFQRLGLAIETWNEITRRMAEARQKGIEV